MNEESPKKIIFKKTIGLWPSQHRGKNLEETTQGEDNPPIKRFCLPKENTRTPLHNPTQL